KDIFEGRLTSSGKSTHHETPLQIPHRQAVGRQVKFRMQHGRITVHRVEEGVKVSAHAVHVYELLHVNLLQDSLVVSVGDGRVIVLGPSGRFVGHAQGGEDPVVKFVFSGQALGHVLQKETGLGTLNNAVVVGGGEVH